MKKVEVDIETRNLIVNEYKQRMMPVELMPSKYGISMRVFYRVLTEEGVEIIRKPRKYSKPPKHDLSGKRFNHLVVLKMELTAGSSGKVYRSICICDCGRSASVNTNYLMRNLVKTCGHVECIYHRQDYSNSGNKNIKFTGFEEISGQLWSAYKCGANRRKLDFNITIEYAWNLYLKQQRKCAMSGLDIYFGKTNTSPKTASLDRIDNTKGYVENNIHWVHKDINKMKMDLPIENFINLCKLISLNN